MDIRLVVESCPAELRVLEFTGEESISDLFHFRIDVVSTVALDARLLEMPARLSFTTGETMRHVHGIVVDIEQRDDGKTRTAYRMHIMPDVARLTHSSDCRYFQELNAPEIIAAVLREAGIPDEAFRFALQTTPPKRELCAQYRETHWNFISRLLEEEGIHYFFEHTEEAAILVMADAAAAHDPILGRRIEFRPPVGAMAHGEHVARFAWSTRLVSRKTTLRDYNFKMPHVSLESSAPNAQRSPLELYDAPGLYETPSRGSFLATMRLEEIQANHRTGSGASDSCRLLPGRTFSLVDHPHDDMNADYLVTRVEHHGSAPSPDAETNESASYENQFHVIPAKTPLRPSRKTSKPRIHGTQSAVVVGPAGEHIHTDKFGRIKVQCFWDRLGQLNEKSSCWIRVAQSFAGPGYGASFLPRVGHEVLVTFIDGDPDRPIVTHSLYNAANVPPFPLPQNKTQNGIRTQTVGGEGSNEFRFDDAKGAEHIYLHASRDLNEVVEHDHSAIVHGKRNQTVDQSDTERVRGDQSLTVERTRRTTVHGNDHTVIEGNNPEPSGFRGGSITIQGKFHIHASDLIEIIAPNEIRIAVGSTSIVLDPSKITAQAGGGAKLVLDANAFMESAAGASCLLDANACTKATGGAKLFLDANVCASSAAGSEMLLDANAKIESTGASTLLLDGNASLTSPADATLGGANAAVVADGLAAMAGAAGAVNADAAGVTASGGKVDIAGSGVVNVGSALLNMN